MAKKPEVKNIEWSENRPGIYRVNCPGCGKSTQFVGPDIGPHQVMVSAREAGWVVAHRANQLRIYCSQSCARKGGEELGAQVKGEKRATGTVQLEDGRTVQLVGAPKSVAKTEAGKTGKKKATRVPRA